MIPVPRHRRTGTGPLQMPPHGHHTFREARINTGLNPGLNPPGLKPPWAKPWAKPEHNSCNATQLQLVTGRNGRRGGNKANCTLHVAGDLRSPAVVVAPAGAASKHTARKPHLQLGNRTGPQSSCKPANCCYTTTLLKLPVLKTAAHNKYEYYFFNRFKTAAHNKY